MTEVALLGIRPGEWLLGIATLGLWWATLMLVREAKHSSERQQRAYVYPTKTATVSTGFAIQTPIRAGHAPGAILVAANVGQTPAYQAQIFGAIDIVAWPIIETSLSPLPFHDRTISKTTAGPNIEITKSHILGRPLTGEEFAGLENGTHALVAHGEIRYKDAFGKARWTKYRYFVGGPFGLQGVAMGQHAEGNDSF